MVQKKQQEIKSSSTTTAKKNSTKPESTTKVATATTTVAKTTTKPKANTETSTTSTANTVDCEVIGFEEFEILVKYNKQNNGKIHIVHSGIKESLPASQFKKGQKISNVSVIQSNQLSLVPNVLNRSSLKVGMEVDTYTLGRTSNNDLSVWISHNIIGTIDIVSNFKSLKSFLKYKESSQYLKCIIKSISNEKIELNLKEEQPKKIKAGIKVIGVVTEINTLNMKLRLQNNLSGTVKLIDTCDDGFRSTPFSIYKVGDIISTFVKSVGSKDGISLSLYSNLLGEKKVQRNPQYASYPLVKRMIVEPSVGKHVWGYVLEKTDQMVLVELTHDVLAVLLTSEIEALYVESIHVGKIIQVTVRSEPKVEGSKKMVQANLFTGITLTDKNIKVGMVLPLQVVDIKDYGVFVKTGRVNALCHIKDISDDNINAAALKELYAPGDFVIGKCTNVEYNQEKKRFIINFSLKSSLFQDVDLESISKISWDKEDNEEELVKRLPYKSLEKYLIKDDSATNSQESIFTKSSIFSAASDSTNKRKLDDTKDLYEDDDQIDEDQVTDKKKQKVEKSKSKKQQEEQIKEREDLLADHNVAPEGPQDFERLLLGSPNSSFVWIKYMSYYLSLSEISRARDIGERAIKKILATEVLEQRNIWIALYNLENLYGSPDSLLKLFQRSIQYQDPKTMYLVLIGILEGSNKFDRVEEYFKLLFKKYKQSAKIWCRYGEYLLKAGKIDEFSQLLSKALPMLPKKKQIKVISKFGQMEFKQGDIERGRTIFEGLVSNYPSRTDLWNVYLDMECRDKQRISTRDAKEKVRQLLDRCINLKVSDKNIKMFFKRYLTFEKEHGSPSTVQKVKQLAIKFVENSSA
ncbi:hypothetical protein CYY_010390 [Polysphondylium violaceum]|uniref:S1 motif domain-containing protein n=1 Tax=Polysphondylium violaceum TaxID=133409 RepID=A0A8J4PKQ2_9MYCE|nr:hypothetical protein CYY_010390 [Polysphondylium violaceum]